MFVDTGINLDLPAGASQKPRLPKRSQILAPIRTHVAQRTEGQEYPGERAELRTGRHTGFPATRQGDGGDAPMLQVKRCCFRKSRRKDLLLLIIHVGQRDSLAQTIETSAASGVEFGNGKN